MEREVDLKSGVDITTCLDTLEMESEFIERDEDVGTCAIKKQEHVRRCYLSNIRQKNPICKNCQIKGPLAKVCCRKTKSEESVLRKYKYEITNEQINYNNRMETNKGESRRVAEKENLYNNLNYEDENYNNSNIYSKSPLEVQLNVDGKQMTFEIDTGSEITIISENAYKNQFSKLKLERTSKIVRTYSYQELMVLGRLRVSVKYKEKIYSEMKLYVIRGGDANLLGRNWLSVIKLNWNNIFYSIHQNIISRQTSKQINEGLKKLMKEHSAMLADKSGTIKELKAKLSVTPGAQPIFCQPRDIPIAFNEAVENEIYRLEENGILKSVTDSDWASPVLIVPKPNGKIRICGDYKRTVNSVIENEEFPIPTPVDLLSKMEGGKKFSSIDLTQAYSQVELHEESKKYLVINTSKGLKEYTRMPYGIKLATGIFQRHIIQALSGIERTVVKIDDILVSGISDDDHLNNLNKVFKILEEMGATINIKKCSFFAQQVEYVGFIIDKNGIHVNPKKVNAILEIPQPSSLKELQSFIGGINYYSRFIENVTRIANPLYKLIKEGSSWRWTNKEKIAFETLKLSLSRYPVLCLYDPQWPMILACGASYYGLGAVISHVYPDGSEKPLAFASRTLNKYEINYSQVDKKGASVIFGLKKFNQYLLGRRFTIITDNKAIRKIFDPTTALSPLAAAYLVRWSLILNQYEYSIQFKPTKENCNADMLSKLPMSEKSEYLEDNITYNLQIASLPVSVERIRNETKNDDLLKHVMQCIKSEQWPKEVDKLLKPYYDKRRELTIEDDVIFWGIRVVIPFSIQWEVLKELHTQHPGIVGMKALSRVHVWFPNIDKHIERIVKDCANCAKVANESAKSVCHPWSWPTKAMDKIYINYFEYNENVYLMMVDSYSKWMDVKVTNKIVCINAIKCLKHWFSVYGLPKQIISNNQSHFKSSEFAKFMQCNGIQHICTPSNHHNTNVQIERYVQTMKIGLNLYTSKKGDAQENIDKFLMSYRSMPSTSTGLIPSKLFIGRQLQTKLDLMKPKCEINVRKATNPVNKYRQEPLNI